jgi:hypothetical protein
MPEAPKIQFPADINIALALDMLIFTVDRSPGAETRGSAAAGCRQHFSDRALRRM